MTIRRLRDTPGGNDPYGDPIAGLSASMVLDGAFVAPRETSDLDGPGRSGVTVGYDLFAAFGADLLNTDRVELIGELPGTDGIYEIDGEVAPWRNALTGTEFRTVAALKRVAG